MEKARTALNAVKGLTVSGTRSWRVRTILTCRGLGEQVVDSQSGPSGWTSSHATAVDESRAHWQIGNGFESAGSA